MPQTNFKELMTRHRTVLAEVVAALTQTFHEVRAADELEGQDKNEMCANIMLALRASEDAAMRLGKAIQASEGGKSPLGGPDTPTGVSGTRKQ